MGCCGADIAVDGVVDAASTGDFARIEEVLRSGHREDDGSVRYVLSAPDIHCGQCISAIERGLSGLEGVVSARVNLSLKRVTVILDNAERTPAEVLRTLDTLGYRATPVDFGDLEDSPQARQTSRLLKSMAVAGFAAGNIMLLSVSVWSGAEGATRDLFHLISGLIAIPVVTYSGQVFFSSAARALAAGRLNMDVPISLAVILALVMSVYESLTGGAEAYFDAAVTLLFFLLIGRYLDQLMRDHARSAVLGLSKMTARGGTVIAPDGRPAYVPVDEIEPGMTLRVAAGERIPADGTVLKGASDLDRSLVTGESAPVAVAANSGVEAGTLNLTGPLDITVTRKAEESFIAEVMQMMEAAENGRGRYVRIADRMAQIYAPAVHLLALFAFAGWMIATGGDWHASLYTAIAVLIVTCPCALGLAVPVVHVIGAARLFGDGILMKDGSALERLAEADAAIFDKTGTLTTGAPVISDVTIDPDDAPGAKALAAHSIHPASRAIAAFFADVDAADLAEIREAPGHGVEGIWNGRKVRLGRAGWVAEIASGTAGGAVAPGIAFAVEGGALATFALAETLRAGATEAVRALKDAGMPVELLSGDAAPAVETVARIGGIDHWHSGATPSAKIARIRELHADGRRVLMVGDGLNDAPALAAGHVSMAPASASDIGRMAADFVFTRESMDAVPFAHAVAVRAGRLVRQNFGLALIYNCIAVPLAVAGLVTPLVAALAMSGSSIVVIANSMRLARGGKLLPGFKGAQEVPQTSEALA
ncbi:heavy metal translocating P-type ATPase [Oricola cellulosilytica]|uniref:Cadmium-translocating P-type ATPase n=1 Tax=Oricola cellulosilytica TaxID=1429082 RepID=A0A4R0PEX7_9HYPH|nr:heavy metal translocating P-type ATPase [Oricola cellulosilytica]TCD14935.1 cadmium-translocating P-type ATPase [Oricola cellulosilytica]